MDTKHFKRVVEDSPPWYIRAILFFRPVRCVITDDMAVLFQTLGSTVYVLAMFRLDRSTILPDARFN